MIRRMIVFMYGADYDPTDYFQCKDVGCIDLACAYRDNCAEVAHYPTDWNSFYHPHTCACHVPSKLDEGQMPPRTSWGPMHYCPEPLSTHATMFYMGEKYGVEGLCKLATEKFKTCLCQHHIATDDFINAVSIVHSTTPEHKRELRDLVARCFKKHYYCDLVKYPEIEANLPEFNRLSMAFMVALRDARIAAMLFDDD